MVLLHGFVLCHIRQCQKAAGLSTAPAAAIASAVAAAVAAAAGAAASAASAAPETEHGTQPEPQIHFITTNHFIFCCSREGNPNEYSILQHISFSCMYSAFVALMLLCPKMEATADELVDFCTSAK